MGRYDKIKVYDNGWKQPSRIRVMKNGSWVDFGTNTSSNNKTINVKKSSGFVRATLNRKDTEKSETLYRGYHVGAYDINTKQAYCFCTSAAPQKRFYAKMVVRAKGACRLFEIKANVFDCSLYVGIKADGTVYYRLRDYQFVGKTWEHTVGKISMGFDQGWQTIELVGDVGNNRFKGWINGVNTSSESYHTAWNDNSYGYVGDNNGNLQIQHGGVYFNTYGNTFNTSYNDSYINKYTVTTWV
jgi:hypothetical protein